jgi:alkylmercury lyase
MGTTYTIGKLAKAAGVPVSTVRYYEQRGLLKPDARTAARYRVYGPDGMKRLRFIRAAQGSGFTLEDIGMLLELRGGALDPCAEVLSILERRVERVEGQLADLTRIRDVLNESIQWCRAPHAEGCCQVIDELEAEAEVLSATPDELAGSLFQRLRGGLRDARLYVSTKRLLANGSPVAPREIADVLGEPLDDVLAALDRVPRIERAGEGDVLGWGLTLNPTPHRFEVDGTELFTWCALDTLFFPALLGRTATVRSTCPDSGDEIRLTVRPDGLEAAEPDRVVVSLVLPERAAACTDVRSAFCDQVHFFRDEEAAVEWLDAHPGGLVLSAEEAFQVGRRLSTHVLTEAGEA